MQGITRSCANRRSQCIGKFVSSGAIKSKVRGAVLKKEHILLLYYPLHDLTQIWCEPSILREPFKGPCTGRVHRTEPYRGAHPTLPVHSGHVSWGGVALPVWLHREQGCWICCIMPGPSGRIMTCTPLPWHACIRAAGLVSTGLASMHSGT